jgi:hypothetical protein
VPGNPDAWSDGETAEHARRVLDDLYAAELQTVQETYALRVSQRRASADIADVARAATYGIVDTVLVDIDDTIPGSVDEHTGAVTIDDTDDAVNYGVVDEIARRVWLNSGTVLASAATTSRATARSPRSSVTRLTFEGRPAECRRDDRTNRWPLGGVPCGGPAQSKPDDVSKRPESADGVQPPFSWRSSSGSLCEQAMGGLEPERAARRRISDCARVRPPIV